MQVFLYEYVTGGGMWQHPGQSPVSTLLAEGRAMIQAIAADFAALPGVQVVTTRDARLPELHPAGCQVTVVDNEAKEREAIQRLANSADWTLLIAPETDCALLEKCRLVEAARGRLLSPSSTVIEIAGDKQATAEALHKRCVPVPRGTLFPPEANEVLRNFELPIVVKPVDGCGSQGVRLIHDRTIDRETTSCDDAKRPIYRIEEFIPGVAASVAVLCGPAGHYALPACEQRLSADGRFAYLGGRLPLEPALDARAGRLALTAIAALPEPRGYVGVDLVLGGDANGSGDRVIEINPRLTTSYVGLRAASRTNLAAAMLAAASGNVPDLSFTSAHVEFTSGGTVSVDAP